MTPGTLQTGGTGCVAADAAAAEPAAFAAVTTTRTLEPTSASPTA
jgi:hypothetical protein